MKTEEEARNTRCCGSEGCGEMRKTSTQYGRYCIASECQGWLWEAINPDGEPYARMNRKRYGYCGLAGRQP